ncbi:hypothetical protein NLM31_12915 [Bradyrhizobium sp. CCGUVB4N]|uniref:hypothetical protein n=1 Tax=Bradyrhizobium sp. CCGUVB4N TaxID=2949631 RepID=UPI0020B36720|nr:hypothetical protein [Bradyrhizobium sp. CCGUVB4N]MCP3381241.1 hypothetical protein [Bradyrhizobium sp. CCGUVB4N]
MNQMKPEFPKKSNSKRRKIFNNRARGRVRTLAKAFYDETGIAVSNAKLDAVTAAILDDYAAIAKKPGFSTEILHPEIKTPDQLLDMLVRGISS